jgi:TRAP-type C4-dicarboxylate transport system permease small subunit
MESMLNFVQRISRGLNVVAGAALTFIMAITVLDVILRAFRSPIVGTYELVGFSGAVVIGFAIPLTSWGRGHIYVDFFVQKFGTRAQNAFNVATRCVGLGLFFLIGWHLLRIAMDLARSGEVSPTLRFPFYPVAFGVGICCFVQCLVLLCDIVKISGGKYE